MRPLWGIHQLGYYVCPPILQFQDFVSIVLCHLHFYAYTCMVMASRTWNVHGTGCHESLWLVSTCSEVLKCYARDKNQATPL